MFFNKKQSLFYENNCEKYEVVKLLFKNRISSFYLVKHDDKYLFLQVASNKRCNNYLELAKFVLNRLKNDAEIYEKHHYEKYGTGYLRYEYLFPKFEKDFIDNKHGGRLVNILSLNCPTDRVESMVSISDIISGSNPATNKVLSTWILEKILRLLVYAHCYNIALPINSDSILINQRHHHIILLDWSTITVYKKSMPKEIKRSNISNAALIALDLNKLENDFGNDSYFNFIKQLSEAPTSNSIRTYLRFRKIRREIFEAES